MTNRSTLVLAAVLFASACGNEHDAPGGPRDDAGDGANVDAGGADDAAMDAPDAASAAYTTIETMVPARDGVKLYTRVYLPTSVPAGGLPAILHREPYPNHTDGSPDMFGPFFVGRGYAYVYQDCRGTNLSEGTFDPMNEVGDGHDASAWVVAQPWSNQAIGTFGGSYSGYAALAAAVDNPSVKVVIADDSPLGLKGWLFEGGQFVYAVIWYYAVEHGDFPSDAIANAASNELALQTLDQKVLGHPLPFWQTLLGITGNGDPYWKDHSLNDLASHICAPVVTPVSLEHVNSVALHQALHDEGCAAQRDHDLVIFTTEGHTEHTFEITTKRTIVNQLELDFLAKYLKGDAVDLSKVPRFLAMAPGEDKYRMSSVWPASDATRTLYLSKTSADGALVPAAPGAETPESMTLDPAQMDPCAGDGYPLLAYASDPLTESTYVAGAPEIELWIQTAVPDANVYVYLGAVDGSDPNAAPDWFDTARMTTRYRDGTDKEVPLPPNQPVKLVLRAEPRPYRVDAGKRLVVAVTNGACSATAEDPLTGEPFAAQTKWGKGDFQVLHDTNHPSHVTLPVQTAAPQYLDYPIEK